MHSEVSVSILETQGILLEPNHRERCTIYLHNRQNVLALCLLVSEVKELFFV